MNKLIEDFFSLIFPDCCYSCQGVLLQGEHKICTSCRGNLPFTFYHKQNPTDNPVTQKFFGKIPIRYGLAFLQFTKGSKVQRLLHHIKYNNQPDLAEMLGNWYGAELRDAHLHKQFDLIVAVPLHPKKMKKRGYNQSEYFGKGLSRHTEIPFDAHAIKRTIHTDTQTKKSRFERWKNVATIFEVPEPEIIKGKSVLIVDDVVTTGSTLEACAQVLLDAQAQSISVATIAVA